MGTILAELVTGDEKRDSRGRKIAGDARREAVLAAYERCGVTQREFARMEGVNYHTLVDWLVRRRRERGPAQPPVGAFCGAAAAGGWERRAGGVPARGRDRARTRRGAGGGTGEGATLMLAFPAGFKICLLYTSPSPRDCS